MSRSWDAVEGGQERVDGREMGAARESRPAAERGCASILWLPAGRGQIDRQPGDRVLQDSDTRRRWWMTAEGEDGEGLGMYGGGCGGWLQNKRQDASRL